MRCGKLFGIGLVITIVMLACGAMAAEWCGENGVIRFSFTNEGDLQSVATAEPNEHGLTIIDLYAFLDEVDPVEHGGEAFINVGGFELKLVIEGSQASILEQGFPHKIMNIGPETGWCLVGIDGGADIRNGRAYLARWKLAFPETPKNVVFRLDPSGVVSCRNIPSCVESGVQALYVGTVQSAQAGLFVGAGCAPAYLNWEGDPDLTSVHTSAHWTTVGVFDRHER